MSTTINNNPAYHQVKQAIAGDASLRTLSRTSAVPVRDQLLSDDDDRDTVTIQSFRAAIRPVESFRDLSLHHRATALFSNIRKASSPSRVRGPVLLSQHPHLLLDLEMNQDLPLEEACHLYTESTAASPRRGGDLYVILRPSVKRAFRKATHFRLTRALGVISDTVYDNRAGRYMPVAPQVNGLHAVSHTDFIPLERLAPEVTLRTALSIPSLPPTAVVMELLGIEFFEKAGKLCRSLPHAKAMKVIAVM